MLSLKAASKNSGPGAEERLDQKREKLEFSLDLVVEDRDREREEQRDYFVRKPKGCYHRMLSLRDLDEVDHELTQKGNQRGQVRVDAIVHRDHAHKPDEDVESAEAEKPLIELAEVQTARNLIVEPTSQLDCTLM